MFSEKFRSLIYRGSISAFAKKLESKNKNHDNDILDENAQAQNYKVTRNSGS